MTPAPALDDLTRLVRDATVVPLGQRLSPAMPIAPHAPFRYHLDMRHGGGPPLPGQDPRVSGAVDSVAFGLHSGTHMDNLSHVGVDGCLHDGTELEGPGVQSDELGIRMSEGAGMRPILAPGVLLDFCAFLGHDVVPGDHVITPEEMIACAEREGVSIDAGDVVLLRTGWDTLWSDPPRFLTPPFPGPALPAARFLSERGVVATGSDTMTYEGAPGETLAVHAELLVHAGVYIMECLDLTELARLRAYRFLFVALPLNLPTATGSPIGPVAVLPASAA